MTCTSGCGSAPQGCPDQYGCVSGVCADFTIRRNDTKPPFKVKMENCDGPLDLTDLILEASMWAKGKLKKNISSTDTYFGLADNIGFHQIMVGDTIIMDRPRNPEHMLVVGFDEEDSLILVQRGYHGTTAQSWKRGTPLRILKFSNAQAQTEMLFQDVLEIDGTVTTNVLTDSFFVYEWRANDTCLPGCYYLEFKLIRMVDESSPLDLIDDNLDDNDIKSPSVITIPVPSHITLPSVIPSGPYVFDHVGMSHISHIPSFITPDSPSTLGCGLSEGVEWIRRFPVDNEGFLIHITDSPTSE